MPPSRRRQKAGDDQPKDPDTGGGDGASSGQKQPAKASGPARRSNALSLEQLSDRVDLLSKNSLHQGNVIKAGEKFTVTQFFYQPLSKCGAENMYGEVITSRR